MVERKPQDHLLAPLICEEVPNLEALLSPSGFRSHLSPQDPLLALPVGAVLVEVFPRLGLVPTPPALAVGRFFVQ